MTYIQLYTTLLSVMLINMGIVTINVIIKSVLDLYYYKITLSGRLLSIIVFSIVHSTVIISIVGLSLVFDLNYVTWMLHAYELGIALLTGITLLVISYNIIMYLDDTY